MGEKSPAPTSSIRGKRAIGFWTDHIIQPDQRSASPFAQFVDQPEMGILDASSKTTAPGRANDVGEGKQPRWPTAKTGIFAGSFRSIFHPFLTDEEQFANLQLWNAGRGESASNFAFFRLAVQNLNLRNAHPGRRRDSPHVA